jgi:hypothetical protein
MCGNKEIKGTSYNPSVKRKAVFKKSNDFSKIKLTHFSGTRLPCV